MLGGGGGSRLEYFFFCLHIDGPISGGLISKGGWGGAYNQDFPSQEPGSLVRNRVNTG